MLLTQNILLRPKFKGSSAKRHSSKPQLRTEHRKKEHKTNPTAETVRNTIIGHFTDFSPYEFEKYISSLLQAAVKSSVSKITRGPLVFAFMRLTLSMQERTFLSRMGRRLLCIIAKKKKAFRYATLVALQKGERLLTLAFLPVLLSQKRKDTVATLLKFVQGMHLKARLIVMERGYSDRIVTIFR